MNIKNYRNKTVSCILFFTFFILPALLCSCESGVDPYNDPVPNSITNTGSIPIHIVWDKAIPTNAAGTHMKALILNPDNTIDCEGSDIDLILVRVYDQESGTLLVDNGNGWDCGDHYGVIDKVAAGSGRKVVVIGKDGDGNVLFHGERSRITVLEGQTAKTAEMVIIEAIPFHPPEEITPENGTTVVNCTFQWHPIEGAVKYLIHLSEDSNFASLFVNETVKGTSFSPIIALNAATYYWRIKAIDKYDNQSVWSEYLMFSALTGEVTMPVSVDITDYSITTAGKPFLLTVNTDGSMVYFTEKETDKIGSFNTSSNDILEYETGSGVRTWDIAWNPVYGKVYFTGGSSTDDHYGIFDPLTETINTYTTEISGISTVDCNVDQNGIFWFNGWDSQTLVSVTDTTTDDGYSLPDFGYTSGLAIDSGGNKWLTIVGMYEQNPSLIRISASGDITTIPLPGITQATIRGTLAAFNKIWFMYSVYNNGYTYQSSIGCYNPTDATFEYYDIPGDSGISAIDDDTQGRIWFAANYANQVGVLNPETGDMLMYDVPTENSGITNIVVDKDRKVIWFTEAEANKIGKLIFTDSN